MSGFEVLWGIDHEEKTKPTYDANHNHEMTVGDIREIEPPGLGLEEGELDLVALLLDISVSDIRDAPVPVVCTIICNRTSTVRHSPSILLRLEHLSTYGTTVATKRLNGRMRSDDRYR